MIKRIFFIFTLSLGLTTVWADATLPNDNNLALNDDPSSLSNPGDLNDEDRLSQLNPNLDNLNGSSGFAKNSLNPDDTGNDDVDLDSNSDPDSLNTDTPYA
ncbi:MAG: hypothetical protein K0S08_1190 [Gammaproteobacteria bacterium]|jgi:hypothetical protein|nr:hypothetical protein [Gammaproteobacteria bacterium]